MIPKAYSMLLAGLFSLAVMTACGDDPPGAAARESTGSEVRLSDAQQNAAGIVIAPTRVVSLQPTVSVPGSIQPPDTAQMMVGSLLSRNCMQPSIMYSSIHRVFTGGCFRSRTASHASQTLTS